jgi:hypothetical protein
MLGLMVSPFDRPAVATLLAATPYADVAVDTRSGPHVTPAAFAAADGRVWVVSSRRTLRVRSVRRRHAASVLVRTGDRALVVSGSADVLSLWRPSETVGLVINTVPVVRAATTYALRNAGLLVNGFLRDFVAGAGDLTVYDRVLVAIEPERGLLLDGDEVLDIWGRWGRVRPVERERSAAPVPPLDDLLADVPPAVVGALDNTDSASVGWRCPTGPVVLPALNAQADGHVQVATAALDVVGAPARAQACATFHVADSVRPSTYRGVILRGEGRVVRRSAARSTVEVAADRVSWWSGFHSGTARAQAA